MEYRRFGDTIIARMDKGEEIIEQVRRIAEAEKIGLASIEALGALNDFNVGLFDVTEKKFHGNHFHGAYEIVSLTGTINTKDGEFYTHLHMSAADADAHVFGGHLVDATISATCEMVIRVLDGKVDRYFDEEVGLNLFKCL